MKAVTTVPRSLKIDGCWLWNDVTVKHFDWQHPRVERLARFSVPGPDIIPTLRSIIFSKWQTIWNSNPNNKLCKVFPKLQHFSPSHQSYARKDKTILNRLFIGHTPVTHSYFLNKEEPPAYNQCKCLLTAEHILTKWTQLNALYTNKLEKNIENILSSLTF